MKLVKIKLINFGIYENENEIEFTTESDQKLTLIIGKNGAGKTTLLNAIRTSFYGPLLFKVKSINEDYQNYILNMLNNNAKKDNASIFSIEITFVSNILRSDGEYTINRSWSANKSKITEVVSVKKNSFLLSDDEREDFLNVFYQNYPIELFDLFFFDGEKIDQLSILNHDIVDVLETAFNLNQYKNLKSDLEKYAVNKVKNNDLRLLEKQKSHLSELIPIKEDKRNNLLKSIHETKNELSTLKLNISTMSNQGFNNLETLDDAQVKIIQKDLDELNKSYKQIITETLPFLAMKTELAKLTQQLRLENQSLKYETVKSELSKLNLVTLSKELPSIDNETIESIINAISNQFQVQSNIVKIHDVTNEQYNQIRKVNNIIKNFSYNDFFELQKSIQNKRVEFDQIKKMTIEKQSLEYRIQFDQLMNIQSQTVQLEIKLNEMVTELETLESELEQLRLEREQLAQNIWRQLKSSNVNTLIIKTNKVLDEYIKEIKEVKLKSIQTETLSMFNSIIRKENFLREIILNEQGIQFIDYENNILSHSQISAGERQIFTLCLLVSILKTTKRVTPLVFDTLLGRLDHNHRHKLLNSLISAATGQVIILATDSEIDETTTSELSSNVNKVIEIDYYNK